MIPLSGFHADRAAFGCGAKKKRMLNIKPKFTPADIQRLVGERIARIEASIIQRLQYIGERFVTRARQVADFTDRTGNLRGSIAYVVLKNGEELHSDFDAEKLGANEASRVIGEIKQHFPKGLALIVVAGMEYAAAVESKNYDVITSSSLIAEDELRKEIDKLKASIKKMR